MVEVAHVAARMDCRFKAMFWRITSRRGKNVAYVAVARKLLTVIWHLLCNGEVFVEEGFSKTPLRVKAKISGNDNDEGGLFLDDVAGVLGYVGRLVSDGG